MSCDLFGIRAKTVKYWIKLYKYFKYFFWAHKIDLPASQIKSDSETVPLLGTDPLLRHSWLRKRFP